MIATNDTRISVLITGIISAAILLFLCLFSFSGEKYTSLANVKQGSGGVSVVLENAEASSIAGTSPAKKQDETEEQLYTSASGTNLQQENRKPSALLQQYMHVKAKNTVTIPGSETHEAIPGNTPFGTQQTIPGTDPFVQTGKLQYNLKGRKLVSPPAAISDTKEEGIVEVLIRVDQYGQVVFAEPTGRATTTASPALKSKARQAALTAKFDSSSMQTEQTGSLIFKFEY